MRAESRRQNYSKFTTLIDMGTVALADTNDKHIEFRNFNAKDLLDREPKLADYYFVRVKKATIRWQLKGFNKIDYRLERPRTGTYMASTSDISDGGFRFYFADANLQAWTNQALHGSDQIDKNRDFNLDTFSGNTRLPKIHSAWGGSRTFRPYIMDLITSVKTNLTDLNNNEFGTATRVQKNFNGWHTVGGESDSTWTNDIRLIIPEFTRQVYQDEQYDATNTTLQNIIRLRQRPNFPEYKIQMLVEYEAKGMAQGLQIVYPGPDEEAKVLKSKIEPAANEINMDFEKVKEDVKESVMDQITGSHPVIAAVATVAGLRKRPRHDEFKM